MMLLVVAQTQIQSQIILLQGSVIKLLEEALLTGKMPDINRLYNISEFARDGSIRALRDQYQRLLESAPIPQRPRGLLRRTSSTPSLRDGSTTAGRSYPLSQQERSSNGDSIPLHCRHAQEAQHTRRPLDSFVVARHASTVCTACGVAFGGREGEDGCRSWRVEKEVTVRHPDSKRVDRRYPSPGRDGALETVMVRTFLLTRRFVFKCHRERSGYACYLCLLHRDWDTLCASEEGLVSHVTSKHSIAEYEGDPDIRELSRTLPFRPQAGQ